MPHDDPIKATSRNNKVVLYTKGVAGVLSSFDVWPLKKLYLTHYSACTDYFRIFVRLEWMDTRTTHDLTRGWCCIYYRMCFSQFKFNFLLYTYMIINIALLDDFSRTGLRGKGGTTVLWLAGTRSARGLSLLTASPLTAQGRGKLMLLLECDVPFYRRHCGGLPWGKSGSEDKEQKKKKIQTRSKMS